MDADQNSNRRTSHHIDMDNMPFSTSSPKKTSLPGPDDSGVSVQLSDLSHNSSESDEMERLNGDGKEAVVNIDEDEGEEDEHMDASSSLVDMVSQKCGKQLKLAIIILLGLLYAAYFITSLVFHGLKSCTEQHNITPLIYLTVASLLIVIAWFVKSKFSEDINRGCMVPLNKSINNHWYCLKWILLIAPLMGVIGIVIMSAVQRPSNLMSLLGWSFFFVLLIICSRAPRKVHWRPVLGGFALQLYFATLILKWDKGYELFSAIGDIFTKFLSYSNFGAMFVFNNIEDHIFAFKVLPVIIFFSCVITMLYYLGIMQAVIGKIAFVMRLTLGTTAAESLCAAGNIFVGQTEAPIMIRPFLAIMTRSELHAVMVGGFSTIAGAVLAAYIMKGVSATHLITASVMNAPTALAVSKLLYPELGRSRISKMKEVIEEKQPFNNVIEAAAAGASAAISLVANVGANLIAFVALLYFVNGAISWFGAFICYPELSFQVICGYALRPLTYIMGVSWEDAGMVAELIGMKTFLNEFVAYDTLSGMIKNRVQCLDGPMISVRSEIIATYALCGFANLSSIGIQLGGLGPMAPNRLGDLAQIAFSALFGGIVTNLMTACIAGLLVVETPFDGSCLNTTVISLVNSTAL